MLRTRFSRLGRISILALASAGLAFACGDSAGDPVDGGTDASTLDAPSPDALGPDAGERRLDPADFELTQVRAEGDRTVVVGLPRVALAKSDVAVIVNRRDPQSVAVSNHYVSARRLPANLHIDLDFDPAAPMTPEAWKPIKESIDRQADALGVEALAVSWTTPWEIQGESITSAVTFGYDPKYASIGTCSPTQPSPLFDSNASRPFSAFKVRPSMMLAGEDVARVQTLIDRSVSADRTFPLGSGYFIRTTDRARSVRFPAFRGAAEAFSRPYAPLDLQYVESTSAADDAIRNVANVLFYFTGLVQVPGLETLTFRPGAVADHLTSFGGVLKGGSQMSVLRWLEAGASASYGTVREPCSYLEKFPAAGRVVDHLLHGRTVLEAYWASVQWPGEGIFVGDPLTRPYGGFVTDMAGVGGKLKLHAGALRGGHRYELLSGRSWNGPWKTQRAWTAATDTIGFEELDADADGAIVVLVDNGPEPPVAILEGSRFTIAEQTVLSARGGEPWIAEVGRVKNRRLAWRRKDANPLQLASDGKRAAWVTAEENGRVEMEDLATREHRTLTLPPKSDGSVASVTGLSLDGNRLVWSDNRFGNFDVFSYDWPTRELERLTADPAPEHSPSVSGNRAAWVRQGSPNMISVYDFGTKSEQLLPSPPGSFSEGSPALAGDWLVWARGNSTTLVGHAMRARVSTLPATEDLFPGRSNAGRPVVAGDRAAFCDASSGRSHIWSRSPAGLARVTPFEGATSCNLSVSSKLTGWMGRMDQVFLRPEPGFVGGVVLEAPSDGASGRTAEIIFRHVRASEPSATFEATLLDGTSIATLGAALAAGKAGDANADGTVDARDAAFVSSGLGKRKGAAGYDARADLDDDGEITALDVTMQATDAGRGGIVGVFTLPVPASLATAPIVVRFVAKRDAAELARAAVRFEANAAPVVFGIRNLVVKAGERLTAHVWASDPDESDAVEAFDDVPSVAWATLGATVTRGPLGDLDGNGVVTALDVGRTRGLVGSVRGDGRYEPRADFDDDGDIDQDDVTFLTSYVGSRSLILDWTPTVAQKGTYAVRFDAWDGRTELVSRVLQITVE